jgi:hypothetical protein
VKDEAQRATCTDYTDQDLEFAMKVQEFFWTGRDTKTAELAQMIAEYAHSNPDSARWRAFKSFAKPAYVAGTAPCDSRADGADVVCYADSWADLEAVIDRHIGAGKPT